MEKEVLLHLYYLYNLQIKRKWVNTLKRRRILVAKDNERNLAMAIEILDVHNLSM